MKYIEICAISKWLLMKVCGHTTLHKGLSTRSYSLTGPLISVFPHSTWGNSPQTRGVFKDQRPTREFLHLEGGGVVSTWVLSMCRLMGHLKWLREMLEQIITCFVNFHLHIVFYLTIYLHLYWHYNYLHLYWHYIKIHIDITFIYMTVQFISTIIATKKWLVW